MKNNNMLCKHPPAVIFFAALCAGHSAWTVGTTFFLKDYLLFYGAEPEQCVDCAGDHRMYVHWCAFGLDRK